MPLNLKLFNNFKWFKSEPQKSIILRYGFAISIVFITLLLKLVLISSIQWPEGSLIIATLTILLSAWYGGLGPGIAATLLNYLISDLLFVGPHDLLIHNTLSQNLRFLVFVVDGFITSWVCESLRKATRKSEAQRLLVEQKEEFFRSLTENVKDYAIFMVSKSGRIMSWNKGAVLITGYDISQALNKPFSILFPSEDIKNKKPKKYLKLSLKKGRIEYESWKVKKDGSKFLANLVITPLKETEKQLHGYSVIIKDMTERSYLENLKTEFLSIAAHELKTPITVCKVITEMLLDKYRRNKIKETKEVYDIEAELNKLEILVNDLLDISRAENKKLKIHIKRVNMTALIRSIINKMKKISGGHSIIFLGDPKIVLQADPDRLEQVLINLITNSLRYSKRNSEIVLNLSQINNHALVRVQDQGAGIPKEDQKHIFEKYYQAEGKLQRGFGLGLYISKKLVNLHKGKIWLESEEGKGASFYFTLPINSS